MSYKSIIKVVGVVVAAAAVVFTGCDVYDDPDYGKYEVVNQSSSWADAKREAERRGGYLAVITSEAEQRTIESLIGDGTKDRYWIGGYCESDRVWKWVTGESMSYTNWGPNDPNNYGGNEYSMSFTRQQFYSQGASTLLGQWIDEENGRNNGYIIEFD